MTNKKGRWKQRQEKWKIILEEGMTNKIKMQLVERKWPPPPKNLKWKENKYIKLEEKEKDYWKLDRDEKIGKQECERKLKKERMDNEKKELKGKKSYNKTKKKTTSKEQVQKKRKKTEDINNGTVQSLKIGLKGVTDLSLRRFKVRCVDWFFSSAIMSSLLAQPEPFFKKGTKNKRKREKKFSLELITGLMFGLTFILFMAACNGANPTLRNKWRNTYQITKHLLPS